MFQPDSRNLLLFPYSEKTEKKITRYVKRTELLKAAPSDLCFLIVNVVGSRLSNYLTTRRTQLLLTHVFQKSSLLRLSLAT